MADLTATALFFTFTSLTLITWALGESVEGRAWKGLAYGLMMLFICLATYVTFYYLF